MMGFGYRLYPSVLVKKVFRQYNALIPLMGDVKIIADLYDLLTYFLGALNIYFFYNSTKPKSNNQLSWKVNSQLKTRVTLG